MARKKASDGGGGPNWLDTYADMVTLLLTFFVLLFAMSSIDSGKWEELVKAFASNNPAAQASQQIVLNSDSSDASEAEEEATIAAGGSGTAGLDNSDPEQVNSFEDLYKYLQNYVNKNGLDDSVGVYKGDDYTFIVFQNSIFFDGDSSVVRQDGKTILDYLCGGLVNISNQIGEIKVYGHTAEANENMTLAQRNMDWKLSGDRAGNVLFYMDEKDFIDPGKLSSVGLGQHHPLVPHDGTEATRIKNRRVELYIKKSDNVDSTLDDIYAKINASGAKSADFSTKVSSGSSTSSTNSSSSTSG